MDFHLLSIHGFLIVNRGLATLVKQSLLLSGIIDLRVVSDFRSIIPVRIPKVVHQHRSCHHGRIPILYTRPLWTSWVKDRCRRFTLLAS